MNSPKGANGLPDSCREAVAARGFEITGPRIGAGSYGVVYEAIQKSLDRRVAIKFAEPSLSTDNKLRFVREAKLLARVSHPGIPYVITNGIVNTTPEIPYTIMQFVEGRPLAALMPTLDEVATFEIMLQVLSALAEAHRSKVVHRDVKPDNILVSPTQAYVIDFSIGVSLEPTGSTPRPTVGGTELGHMEYTPPEQKRDPANVGPQADVFSAAVVMCECLTGSTFVAAKNLDGHLRGMNPSLVDALRRALDPEPANRFENAGAFRDALVPLAGQRAYSLRGATLAICTNPRCSGGVSSSSGYHRGPRIERSVDRYCEHCGHAFLRGCPKCARPLPDNIKDLVVTASRGARDALEAHCSGCGELIHRVPTCRNCGSLLRPGDIGIADFGTEGCQKCRNKKPAYAAPASAVPGADDDIPF